MPLEGPVIETPRLILRPPRSEDFEPWCAFSADPEAARHIGGVMAPPQVWRSMMTVAGAWALEGFSMFSVVEKASGRWIGRLGPWRPAGWPGAEVGWGIIRECWGRGYATEGARAVRDYAFHTLGLVRLVALIDPGNIASLRVAAKLGMAYEREVMLEGYTHPDHLYAVGAPTREGAVNPRA